MQSNSVLRTVASLVAIAVGLPAALAALPMEKGYDVTPTGLQPVYPTGYSCSPLTSLYASWIDVDGTRRDEIHTGVDAGRLGEPILSPAPGTIEAAWKANWQWGLEGALLVRFSREDLNLTDGPPFYYADFDHLRYSDVKKFKPGDRIERGQQLAHVFRPGGKSIYLPEVHFEVFEVSDPSKIVWVDNKYGAPNWKNPTARLVDPLYLMALNAPPENGKDVKLQPFDRDFDFTGFKGFSYILPCRKD